MPALQTRQSSIAVRNGQNFFRLFQELESGGDIFEIDTSIKAMCVGPQSDLSNYQINFLDLQSPNAIDEVNLSVFNPFIGRIDALLATTFPSTDNLPARILVTARDLVDNSFVPSTFGGSSFLAARPLPRIDIISYLRDPPAVAPLRDDRVYDFSFISPGASSDAFYILPYYGRRYGHITLCNYNDTTTPDQTYTANVRGINLNAGLQQAPAQTPGASRACETVLGTLSVVEGATDDLIFGQSDGLFDLITIELISNTGFRDENSAMKVTVSDRI